MVLWNFGKDTEHMSNVILKQSLTLRVRMQNVLAPKPVITGHTSATVRGGFARCGLDDCHDRVNESANHLTNLPQYLMGCRREGSLLGLHVSTTHTVSKDGNKLYVCNPEKARSFKSFLGSVIFPSAATYTCKVGFFGDHQD